MLNDAVPTGISGSGSGRIAQLVEQVTLNHRVLGSSPSAPTTRLLLCGSIKTIRIGSQNDTSFKKIFAGVPTLPRAVPSLLH